MSLQLSAITCLEDVLLKVAYLFRLSALVAQCDSREPALMTD
jgi:hypothetical protein